MENLTWSAKNNDDDKQKFDKQHLKWVTVKARYITPAYTILR